MFTIIGGDGREYGPASVPQIRNWIAAGRADLDTQAKAAGTIEWKRLGEFPEFSGDAPPVIAASASIGAAPASRGARLGAALIDGAVFFLCLVPAMNALMNSELGAQIQRGEQPDLTNLAALGPTLHLMRMGTLVAAVAQTVVLAARSQTIGKLLLRLRIVRHPDGSPAGLARVVLLRSWLFWAGYLTPLFGMLLFLLDSALIFNSERRCLHDLVAGTRVVRAGPVTGPAP